MYLVFMKLLDNIIKPANTTILNFIFQDKFFY
jgi:hypothetical protein